jgi:hypothetical protein
MIAAGAWVHGGDQLEPRRKRYSPASSNNVHDSLFEWSAKSVEYRWPEFRKLVQKQDSPMGERRLPWSGNRSTAQKPG